MSTRALDERPVLGRAAIVASVALAMVATAMAVGAAAGIGELETSVALALAIPLAIVVVTYPWAAVLVWVAAMPFFVVGDSASVGAGVWAVHRLLIPATIVLLLVYRMLGLSRTRFHLSTVDIFIAAFLILAYVNIFALSNNPIRMSVAFFDNIVVPISLYWMIRLADPGPSELRRLVPVVAAVVAVQVGVGVLSWLAPGVLPGAWLGRAGERTIGTLGGPAPYSITLVFGALLFVQAGTDASQRSVRWLLTLLAAAAFVGVLLSLSRGSWLGAGAAILGLFFVFPRMTIPTLVAGALVSLLLATGPLSGQFGVLDERLGDADTAASRLVTNNAALRMITIEPWAGFGYGNFERFDESFKERVGDIPVQPGSAHHAYLALAAENGIPALLLYLLPAAWLLMRSLQLRRHMPVEPYLNRNLVAVLWLAVLSQFIVANFMDMLHSSPWGVGLWWLCLGLIHVTLSRAAANQRASRRSAPLLTGTPA
jgi:O-antigen ligase